MDIEKSKSNDELNIRNTNKEYEIKPLVKTFSSNLVNEASCSNIEPLKEGQWRRAAKDSSERPLEREQFINTNKEEKIEEEVNKDVLKGNFIIKIRKRLL